MEKPLTTPHTEPNTSAAPQSPPEIKVHILTAEEKSDLRKRVLRGEPLTLDQARDVIASIRQGSAAAILAGNSAKPKRGKRASGPGLSDDALDKDLEDLGL